MARLEELGYVRQPHTSAGRVPTDLGYRCYVDQLLSERRSARPAPDVEERLRRAGTVEDVLSHASQEISRASHQVGFAMVPATEATFEHLDFVPLDGGKVLVVAGLDRRPHLAQGDRADRGLLGRRAAAGGELPQLRVQGAVARRGPRRRWSSGCSEDRTLYDELMARALRLASTHVRGHRARAVDLHPGHGAAVRRVAHGDDPETTLATMRSLVQMIEEKSRLVQLIDACMDGSGLTVFIGTEHQDAGPAVVQRRDVDLYRRQAHRRGRHHRPDADAIFARDQRRRQPVKGDQPDGQR